METLEGRLAAFRASIEYVTESLEVNRLSDEEILRSISSISDALKSEWISGVATSTSTTCSAMEHNFKLKMFAKQLEEVAISLWNATVGKKTSASIKETTAALLRQVCYDLITYPLCTIGELKGPANIAYTQRRIMMASKVGKCWLELGEYDKAITAFEKATLDTQTLIESLSVPESEKTDAEVISLQKQLIELYCNTAIAASGAKDHARAFEILTSAANFKIPASSPGLFDRQLDRVSATAYNLGLADTNARNLDSAIKWLNLSFEAGKRKHKTSYKHMALTLRLLAHVHSESGLEGNMQKALNAVELANTYHAHPAGVHLRLKIISKNRLVPDCDVRNVMGELLRHKDLDMDVGLNACSILNTHGRYELCDMGLKELQSRFNGSRQVGKIHVQQLQAAIHRMPTQDALDYTESFLSDMNITKSLNKDAEKNVQLLLWEQASKCNESGEYEHCLSWYNHSLGLFMRGRSLDEIRNDAENAGNLGRLQRNRVSCFINLGRLLQAEEASKIAIDMEPKSRFSMFCKFKVALYLGREKQAIDVVESLAATSSGEEHQHELICLAAQLAFEKNHRSVAIVTLRHLASSGTDNIARLTAFRCLIRLHLALAEEVGSDENTGNPAENMADDTMDGGKESMNTDKPVNVQNKDELTEGAIESLFSAFKLLQQLHEKIDSSNNMETDVIPLPGDRSQGIAAPEFSTEVSWFMKMAWNMALQAKENPHRMKKLYLLCKNLLCLLEPDECALLRQKTCLLMCAACGLTLARVADSLQSMIPELEEVLSTVADCRTVCEHLAAFSGSDFPQSNDKSAVLLLLYHFEALAKLVSAKRGDNRADDLDALFDELHSLPLADAKTFETIAGLAVEYPAYHAEICTRGLKVAIGKIEQSLSTMENKESKNEALKRLSGLYRMLIDTCLKQGSDSDPVNKEESWKHCNEAFLLLSKPDQSFPETELAWLTTRAWNVGVKLFVSDHVVEAEHWCAFALRLLAKLDLYKESYEKRMNSVYQEILEKKDLMTRKLHKTAV